MTLIGLNHFCRLLVLLAGLLEFSAKAQSSLNFSNTATTAIPRRASIIFIQCDGLGYGDLSCYGQAKFQTPNLDNLAAEGIRFTNYFLPDTGWSSQFALMFGKNPTPPPLYIYMPAATSASDEITIAQILKSSGYHTGLIGEWDLGDENSRVAPWKSGYDEFAGYFNQAAAEDFYADYMFRYAPKEIFNLTNNQREDFVGKEELYPNTGGKKSQYIPDLLTKAAMNFVRINWPDRFNHYQPFFLLLNFNIPSQKIEVPTDAPFSEEAWPQPQKNKAALISRIDGYVGLLREQLQRTGMTNDIVIFFSSASVPKITPGIETDFFHSNISTNDLRVPMIVHWPGRILAGQVSGLKWSPQDFLPTAAEIALTPSPTNITGVSILPTLFGRMQTNQAAVN
jgi:arylsulfatase A-like enzyme